MNYICEFLMEEDAIGVVEIILILVVILTIRYGRRTCESCYCLKKKTTQYTERIKYVYRVEGENRRKVD